MPRGKPRVKKDMTRKEAFKRAKFGGYINLHLDTETKAQYEKWATDAKFDQLQGIDEMVTAGYDFKFYYDWAEETVICQILLLTADTLKTWIMSSYHRSAQEAISLALFKHYVVMDGDWTEYMSNENDDSYFG
jgi:hypothetical protein